MTEHPLASRAKACQTKARLTYRIPTAPIWTLELTVIFCHCAVVGDREVAQAVAEGADTVASVCKATGAGQQCGSCIFSVRRVLCDHQAQSQAPARPRGQVQTAPPIGVQVAAS